MAQKTSNKTMKMSEYTLKLIENKKHLGIIDVLTILICNKNGGLNREETLKNIILINDRIANLPPFSIFVKCFAGNNAKWNTIPTLNPLQVELEKNLTWFESAIVMEMFDTYVLENLHKFKPNDTLAIMNHYINRPECRKIYRLLLDLNHIRRCDIPEFFRIFVSNRNCNTIDIYREFIRQESLMVDVKMLQVLCDYNDLKWLASSMTREEVLGMSIGITIMWHDIDQYFCEEFEQAKPEICAFQQAVSAFGAKQTMTDVSMNNNCWLG